MAIRENDTFNGQRVGKMKHKYFVVQCFIDGEWKNASCRFYLQGIRGALNCLDNLKRERPGSKLRIAKGEAVIKF